MIAYIFFRSAIYFTCIKNTDLNIFKTIQYFNDGVCFN